MVQIMWQTTPCTDPSLGLFNMPSSHVLVQCYNQPLLVSHCIYELSMMLIEHMILMTEDRFLIPTSILIQMLFLGGLKSSRCQSDLVQKPNIAALPTLLKVITTIPIVLCYNINTFALSHNPVVHSRTKDMELTYSLFEKRSLTKLWL